MSDDREKTNDVSNPTDRRDRMWEQSARLLGLMNGGAAVALLAFIQAIWKDGPELVVWVAYSLITFAAGLALATIIPQLREATVLNWRSNEPKARVYQFSYRFVAKLSVLSFLIGVVIVAYGILNSLPHTLPTGKL